jgi:hypothetical protein
MFVIPGRATREPGIHNHGREYGFRACAKWRILRCAIAHRGMTSEFDAGRGEVQTWAGMIGFSGAVSGLSAHFTAGSSQLMHWRSVRPEMVITATSRFPHFGQRVN